MERLLIEVRGTVQGVGFRPHVHARASALGLRGFARNRGAHLFIDLEGDPRAAQRFLDELTASPPARAVIDEVTVRRAPPACHSGFSIRPSEPGDSGRCGIPPDAATCEACLTELFDSRNRRYRYPFISCAHCGPRFTIITGMPYDRGRTTMRGFPMCAACRREYEDPADRRFHAQPVACAACGPSLALRNAEGEPAAAADVLEAVAARLAAGGIAAIKGLGGYHLACDAANAGAVAALRERKRRDAKPFAVMVDRGAVERLRRARATDWAALTSTERPIVLVDREAVGLDITEGVSRGCPGVGLMLPYTPVHHLLMELVHRPLVMTSGNTSDEPMVVDDGEALASLRGLADVFLVNDRRIENRCDDSVVRVIGGAPSPIRRSRGLAPSPIAVAETAGAPVLAVGGHQKNTFSVYAGQRIWLSPHVGDLASAAAYSALGDAIARTLAFLDVAPAMIAHDLHPDYLSTRFAEEFPAARRLAVQHHHAHVLSSAAEHGVTGPLLGVAFDGSGLGADGALWGGEFLLADGCGVSRLAHLAYVPLPGGEAVAREPWRSAVAHLAAADHDAMLRAMEPRVGRAFAPVRAMVARGPAAPATSSIGRLFDAVAAIAGVRDRAQFEGQAAMELEALALHGSPRPYAFGLVTDAQPWRLDATPVVRSIADDVLRGVDTAEIAAGFHAALASAIADVAAALAEQTDVSEVALTGGVFQNARLTAEVASRLERKRLRPLIHRTVPCNDGGLSVGQAVAASRVLRSGTASRLEAPACV